MDLLTYQSQKEQALLTSATIAESRGDIKTALGYLRALAALLKIKLDKPPIIDPKSVKGQEKLNEYYLKSLELLMGKTGDNITSIRSQYGNPLQVKNGGKK